MAAGSAGGRVRLRLVCLLALAAAARALQCPAVCECYAQTHAPAHAPEYIRMYLRYGGIALSANCSGAGLAAVPTAALAASTGVLNLSRNSITDIGSDSFRGFNLLTTLDLSRNRISTIHPTGFQNLTVLSSLQLQMNRIAEINVSTFSNNPFMMSLDLSFNSIIIPFEGPFLEISVQKLHMASCNLSYLYNETFIEMPKLVFLNISLNRIQKLEMNIFQTLTHLETLIIENNTDLELVVNTRYSPSLKLDTLSLKGTPLNLTSPLLLPIPRLLIVILDSCNLTKITEETFARATKIDTLVLTRNNFKTISSTSIGNLRFLRRLALDENGIESIDPHTFDENFLLWFLTLNGNPFDFSSATFLNLPSLLYLHMNRCAISGIPEGTFSKCRRIRYISMEGNNISYISEHAFWNLPDLFYLSLRSNKISRIDKESFIHNVGLKELNLAGNPIIIRTDMPFIDAPSLQILNLSSCSIGKLPADLFEHTIYLQKLDISNNTLKYIDPRVVSKLKELEYLDMSGNPLVCDYRLRPLWLLCFDRNISCNTSCARWNSLASATAPPETQAEAEAEAGEPQVGPAATPGGGPLPQAAVAGARSSGRSGLTVFAMLISGTFVGIIVGLVIGSLFLDRIMDLVRGVRLRFIARRSRRDSEYATLDIEERF